MPQGNQEQMLNIDWNKYLVDMINDSYKALYEQLNYCYDNNIAFEEDTKNLYFQNYIEAKINEIRNT